MTTKTLRDESAPAQEIITRKEAKQRGLKHYYSGKACPQGHVDFRYTASGRCAQCCRDWAGKAHFDNHEKRILQMKEWRANNPEYYPNYRQENLEKENARVAAWNAANPERRRSNVRNRRARLRRAEGSHTAEDIKRIYHLQKKKCAWCSKPLKLGDHHVDHIVALINGGSNSPSNLCVTCGPCNQKKQAKDPLDFARQLGKLL